VRHFLAEGGGGAAMNNGTNTYIDVFGQHYGFPSGPKKARNDRTLTQTRNNSFVAESFETGEVVGRLMIGCLRHSVPTNDHRRKNDRKKRNEQPPEVRAESNCRLEAQMDCPRARPAPAIERPDSAEPDQWRWRSWRWGLDRRPVTARYARDARKSITPI
jgi:hypothetical protein